MGVSGLRARLADLCKRKGLVDAHVVSFLPDAATPTGDPILDWPVRIEAVSSSDGTLVLITHPGRDAPDMQAFALPGRASGQVARERDAERRALTSEVFARACRQNDATFSRYDEYEQP